MTDDLSRELRERLGRVSLPAAPSSLRDEIESLRSIPAATPVRRSARPPMMMLAAALVTVSLVAAGIGGALLRERNEPRQDLSLDCQPEPVNRPVEVELPEPEQAGIDRPEPDRRADHLDHGESERGLAGLVRSEPAGRPIVVPILSKVVVHGTNCPGDCSYSSTSGHLADRAGDTGSDAFPWADINDVPSAGTRAPV